MRAVLSLRVGAITRRMYVSLPVYIETDVEWWNGYVYGGASVGY